MEQQKRAEVEKTNLKLKATMTEMHAKHVCCPLTHCHFAEGERERGRDSEGERERGREGEREGGREGGREGLLPPADALPFPALFSFPSSRGEIQEEKEAAGARAAGAEEEEDE